MSIFTALLLVSGLALANSQRYHFSSLPYTSISNHSDGIEEREYESVVLPSYTSISCLTWNAAQSQGYYHLAMYTRNGNNVEGRSLKMGVPVILGVHHVDDIEPRCAQQYTTSFYVDEKELPAPNNTDVKLTQLPVNKLYAISTSNIVRDPSDVVLSLRVKLNALGLCYDPKHYFMASFSSPRSSRNSRTEIWLPVVACVH
uniref:DOMON domain-containing protein n=1 Tax=Strigamia maritima TaxID=126957 RepID=T1IY34_STRMM